MAAGVVLKTKSNAKITKSVWRLKYISYALPGRHFGHTHCGWSVAFAMRRQEEGTTGSSGAFGVPDSTEWSIFICLCGCFPIKTSNVVHALRRSCSATIYRLQSPLGSPLGCGPFRILERLVSVQSNFSSCREIYEGPNITLAWKPLGLAVSMSHRSSRPRTSEVDKEWRQNLPCRGLPPRSIPGHPILI